MTNTNQNTIEIEYNNKTYEIEKDAKEQKVRPKGTIFTAGDEETDANKEITVKDYQETFWSTSATIDENNIELKSGMGKNLTIWGGIPTFFVSIAFMIYRFLSKKKSSEEINELVNTVVKKSEKIKD